MSGPLRLTPTDRLVWDDYLRRNHRAKVMYRLMPTAPRNQTGPRVVCRCGARTHHHDGVCAMCRKGDS